MINIGTPTTKINVIFYIAGNADTNLLAIPMTYTVDGCFASSSAINSLVHGVSDF